MFKRKTTLVTLIIYTAINLFFVGSSLRQLFDISDNWLRALIGQQAGIIHLSIILGLFLNAYLIVRFSSKD